MESRCLAVPTFFKLKTVDIRGRRAWSWSNGVEGYDVVVRDGGGMEVKSFVVALILLAVLFGWYAWLEVGERRRR